MRVPSALSIALVLVVATSATEGAAPDLAGVRELYAAASYEEALAAIDTLEAPDQLEAVEQLRALCLLGLGRTKEAERSLERIVMSKPLYLVPEDASPRLVSLFKEVRRRSLPTAARELYARAKSSYDSKQYSAAATGFSEVLAIAKHPDAAAHVAALEDLRQLAEGFKTLSESAVASQRAAAEAKATAAAAAAAKPPPPPASALALYSSRDAAGVQAPVAIDRRLPVWKPGNSILAQRSFRGTLEVIINDQGLVEWAGMSRPTLENYDQELIALTKSWRFRPATKDGAAVRYQLALEIVLTPPARDE
jgi:hypothetical protein